MNKIGFSKTLWCSIAKPSKYEEMIKIGLKKAIKYFFALIAIMALILSIAGTYIQSTEVQKIAGYVQENVPEFKIENTAKEGEEANYKLNIDNNEAIILDNQDFVNAFKSIFVVNVNIKEKEAIEEYYKLATDNNLCFVLLKDKCIMISNKYNPENENKEEGIAKYNYSEVLNKIGPDFTEFKKKDLVQIFNNTSYTYYIVAYFTNYFTVLLVIFALDVVVLAIIAMIIAKAFKRDIKIKRMFSLAIYSLTLPIILYNIYLIINYFAKLNIDYFNLINMVISIIYIVLYFYKNNKKDIA